VLDAADDDPLTFVPDDVAVEQPAVTIRHRRTRVEHVERGARRRHCEQVADQLVVGGKAVAHTEHDLGAAQGLLSETPRWFESVRRTLAADGCDKQRVATYRWTAIVIPHELALRQRPRNRTVQLE
jgi:hypothetical protein